MYLWGVHVCVHVCVCVNEIQLECSESQISNKREQILKISIYLYAVSIYICIFPTLFFQGINYNVAPGILCADSWYMMKYEARF